MTRKLLIIFALIIVAVATTGIVAAGESVTVNDVQFTLPDGYAPEDSDGYNVAAFGLYFSKDGDLIMIIVMEDTSDMDDIKSNSSYTKKTFGDTEGYLSYGNNSVMFDYIKDGKLVTIGAHEESLIEEIVTA